MLRNREKGNLVLNLEQYGNSYHYLCTSWGGSVSIVTAMGRMTGVLFPAGAGITSLSYCIQTNSEACPTSYRMGSGDPFHRG